ncbi:uncharacterized protein TrAtP1_010350 [Trichoderma atroviride]|uniref:uncharacterized protein n=1 Tax=Hypocrea atroviridis TaxID=63577 RepID=UPI003328373D|nr:hypothetical protein TrAtP1_010350 [Trichoderma atroviride]
MPFPTVRVAATQAEPVWFDLQGAVDKTCKLIEEAASNKADLVGFPEVWIPGYPCWIWGRNVDFDLNVQYIKNSLRLYSPEMQRIQDCARGNNIAVSLSFSENCNNSLYIAQALIGPDGEIKVHRRKMKGTHMERTVFGDGSSHALKSVEELPFARVGALSCWEHLQPLLKYNAITQNGDIHVAAWPPLSNNVVGDFGAYAMTAEGSQTLSRTYAMESGSFVLHCTQVITEKGIKAMNTGGQPIMSTPGGGHSVVFGPDGRVMTEAIPEDEEGIIYAELDMDERVRTKMFVDSTGHYSRPDVLWLGVSPEIPTVVRPQRAGNASEQVDW